YAPFVLAQLSQACGTLPSGRAARSPVNCTNRFVSRLSPKSASPSSLSAQFSILVPLLLSSSFLLSSLSCQRNPYFLATSSRTFWLVGNDKNLHIVLATRADPSLLLSVLRARQQVLEVRTDQLRCTTEEAEAFFKEAKGIQLPNETIKAVNARTEG